MRTTLFATAAPLALAAQPAAARDKCIAVMQLVGVPAGVAAESDEDGTDQNGDGQIWIGQSGSRMMGFLDCSMLPGSQHGDIYEQQYGGGEPHKTGNSQASGQRGRNWFDDTARRNANAGTGGGTGAGTATSGNTNDSRPPQGQSPIAKKKPIAKRQ